MQEASDKAGTNTESGGKFIDILIGQWVKQTGSNIVLNKAEEVAESSNAQDKQQILQNQECVIQSLQRKLKKSQETEALLSASLEVEARNKEEIQTKLNVTWESIDTITEYFNYISESLANFQQHRANLSALYNDVILKQQEAIQKVQLSNTKARDLEAHVARLENKSLLQDERLQEALAEQDNLRKQLENSENKLQLQKNELANTHTEEKLMLVKEQKRLLLEYENLQSQLQTIEKEKNNIAKSAAELENKLLCQEQRMQAMTMEQNNLQKQLENTEREFYSQKNDLTSAYAEEKKTLIEEQERLLTLSEDLQVRLGLLEENKANIIKTIMEKDAFLLKLQNENSAYKNQIEAMITDNNEICGKYETLREKWEEELRIKTEKIKYIEATLSATKQRETNLLNDLNRIEKRLSNEMILSKKLEKKLSDATIDLELSLMQKTELQKDLEGIRTTNELTNIELQQQLQTLQREKEEIVKRESTRIRDAKILCENIQIKHAEEVSALKNSYETQLLELKKTLECLNETTNNIRKENSVLNLTLLEMRMENNNLKNNYQLIMGRNDDLQGKLEETTEMLQVETVADQKPRSKYSKVVRKSSVKRKYEIQHDPEVEEIFQVNQPDISTSLNSNEEQQDNRLSQSLNRVCLTEEGSPKEQEAEVTSAGKKFFKSRPVQPRTYTKRQNL